MRSFLILCYVILHHSHFYYLFNIMFCSRPTLSALKHCWFYSCPIEFSYQLQWYFKLHKIIDALSILTILLWFYASHPNYQDWLRQYVSWSSIWTCMLVLSHNVAKIIEHIFCLCYTNFKSLRSQRFSPFFYLLSPPWSRQLA